MRFKKILKIIGAVFLALFLVLYLLFVNFSSPKSDANIQEAFAEKSVKPKITRHLYQNFEYRKISMQPTLDTLKTTVVFIHGAIGSLMDFKKYLSDSVLRKNANLIAYDRIGYNYEDKHFAQQSLDFEVSVLNDVTKHLNPLKTVLVGYSYGGPIALAVKEKYKSIVLLAPAVYSKVEPLPWMLNIYKWKATRWLVPHVWKSASLEKITHKSELQKYESNWHENSSSIISIHGNDDGIVPYENSLYLQDLFPESNFKLQTLEGAGHDLVWTKSDYILDILKQVIN